jgi:hypothetical protein
MQAYIKMLTVRLFNSIHAAKEQDSSTCHGHHSLKNHLQMASFRILPRYWPRLPSLTGQLHIPHRSSFLPLNQVRYLSSTPPFRNACETRDGLQNNRDLQSLKKSTAAAATTPATTAGRISASDLVLLSTLPPAIEARGEVPSYALVITCKQCDTRSAHKISKQGYHHGTVLLTCPGCKNRHLMADHLKIFSDERITLEDILKEKGDTLKRFTVGEGRLEDGDIELVADEDTDRSDTISE